MRTVAPSPVRTLSGITYPTGMLLLTALLTACGTGAESVSRVLPGPGPMRAARHSWIRPDAGKQWLLYVSDAYSGTVDIYNYRSNKDELYGQLTGFAHPLGLCVDSAGDVFVDDYDNYEIDEYAHGGTTPIASVSDSYGRPDGCAVDRATGNIAVSDGFNPSDAGGNIVVFTGGLEGSETEYGGKNIDLYNFGPPAYDAKGNLFLEGTTYSTQTVFAELPAGTNTLVQLSGLTINQTAAVEWDGSYVDATDGDYKGEGVGAIYRVTVSGSAVRIKRTTILTDDCYGGYDYASFYQPFIGGTTSRRNTVVAGNSSVQCPNRVDVWNFAKGGNPKRVLPADISPVWPFGATLSPPGGAGLR
jgi:hypothetical protein